MCCTCRSLPYNQLAGSLPSIWGQLQSLQVGTCGAPSSNNDTGDTASEVTSQPSTCSRHWQARCAPTECCKRALSFLPLAWVFCRTSS